MGSVHITTSIRTIEDYWDGEQYGDWREEYSYEGLAVYKSSLQGEFGVYTRSIDTDFEPEVGQVVYPVVVLFGTGNSFGNSSGNVHIVGVYDNQDKAERLRKAIQDTYSSGREPSFDFEGENINAYTWTGYFESLENVFVESEIVRA